MATAASQDSEQIEKLEDEIKAIRNCLGRITSALSSLSYHKHKAACTACGVLITEKNRPPEACVYCTLRGRAI